MPLVRRPAPFTHPDWLFEVKWDGFRAVAHIEDGRCRQVSRIGVQIIWNGVSALLFSGHS